MGDKASSPPPLPVPGVKVAHVPGKGRGMFATSSFKAGDVMLDEEPYAAVAMTDVMADEPVCHNDLVTVDEKDLKTCLACNRTRYCSKAAQKSDWNRGHKYECKALRSPHVRPMSMLRLVGRVLWKRAAEMKSKASATANDRDVDALTAAAGKASLDESMPSGSVEGKGNTEDNGLNFWHSFEAVAAMQGSNSIFAGVPRPAVLQLLGSLRHYLSQTKAANNSDERLQEELMVQVMSNAFAIDDPEHGLTLGVGLYPIGALLNHSARPNCGQSFLKGRLQIRALKAIAPGEELEISYVDVHDPTFVQRKDLLFRYGFDLRPELPRDNKFPGARTERLGGCLRATVVDAAASKAVLMDSIDAAHCAVHSPPCAAGGLAPHATRFCSVVVKSNTDIGGGMFGPMVAKGDGDADSDISLVVAQQVLREEWHPQEGTASWLDQVMEEDWDLEVTMLGEWSTAAEEADGWRRVAFAGSFAAAAWVWSRSLRGRGEVGVARRLLLKAERCGRDAGLADSHTAMRPLLQGLLDTFLHQPIRQNAPGAPLAQEARHSLARAQRFEKAMRAIYPDGSGELGWDLDKVGEVAARCDAMPYALRLWREAAALLRAAFSEQRKIMTVVFKAEYFRDDDMHRRMELVRTLGPSLPASVTRALAG